jgi:DNA sulfur modification protein DndE
MKRVKKISAIFCFILFFTGSCQTQRPLCLYLMGDSTMADKPVADNPERGWGQLLPQFFNDKLTVHNHARNGRSTKSFINEGRWQAVYDSLQAGDYVLIQFGHNDQKESDSTRYADPYGAYNNNLRLFVEKIRSKGARPVLLTPIVRRRFDDKGNFTESHGVYPDVVRDVARQLNVPLIDHYKLSRELVVIAGAENSKKIYLWVEPGQYSLFPQGKQDNTHFTEYGAVQMAALVVGQLKQMDLELNKYLR